MEKETRNAIQTATQKARRLLEADFAGQLEGLYDIMLDGRVGVTGGAHLTGRQNLWRDRIIAAIEHKRAAGMTADEAVVDYLRDAAFTALNRFVALKMLEARDLVRECISRGDASSGFTEFCGLAPGVRFPDGSGYRLYLECIFDELSTEVKVLFDRRDPASVLWPTRATFDALLVILNAQDLAGIWGEDETIGWVYQYFNSRADIDRARYDEKGKPKSPQNTRELAVRNQFFTPRYVVQFLTENTLGRIWYEMRDGKTQIAQCCEYLVRRPDETWEPRAKKDPRDLKILDPACGSGHFLLYSFDLLVGIYEEAWADPDSPEMRDHRPDAARGLPADGGSAGGDAGLILRHNLHGVDIDPRCAQIAQLALWMRAQRAFRDFGIAARRATADQAIEYRHRRTDAGRKGASGRIPARPQGRSAGGAPATGFRYPPGAHGEGHQGDGGQSRGARRDGMGGYEARGRDGHAAQDRARSRPRYRTGARGVGGPAAAVPGGRVRPRRRDEGNAYARCPR